MRIFNCKKFTNFEITQYFFSYGILGSLCSIHTFNLKCLMDLISKYVHAEYIFRVTQLMLKIYHIFNFNKYSVGYAVLQFSKANVFPMLQ